MAPASPRPRESSSPRDSARYATRRRNLSRSVSVGLVPRGLIERVIVQGDLEALLTARTASQSFLTMWNVTSDELVRPSVPLQEAARCHLSASGGLSGADVS